LTPTTKLTF